MANPVPAKITRPRPLQVLARPRLFRALDQARAQPVVWITAPPGAGKTTLVSHYLDQRKLKNLWYQVDEGDNDIATLFYYLALAAKKAAPRIRKPLPQLVPEYLPNLNAFFRLFFQVLFGRWKTPHVLVFDNYQEIPADAVFHDAIREALGQLPEGSNIIVLSRNDPPTAFARAQVNGLLARIDWDQIKLTPEEADRLVDLKKKRSTPSPALRKQLYALSEGWMAGLLLLLETSATQEAAELPPHRFAPQVLFDYFGSQIFDRMEAKTRAILVQSAFLPRMTLEAVQQLSGAPHSGRVIQDLHRRNYFIVRHGDDPPVYQYHPLFRNFLLNRAPAMFDSARLKTIMQRAATLLAELDQWEDAVGLFREIQDEPGIVGIVLQHAPALMKQGRTETILSWIHALSEQTIQRTPWVLYWLGMCTLVSDPAKSQPFLERALQLFDAEPNPAGVYLSWSAIVNGIIYGWGDCHPLDRWIGLFDELQVRHGDFPSLEIEIQVTGSMFATLLFRQPHHPRMGFWEERLQALLSSVADPAWAALLGMQLLNHHVWFGYFSKARLLVEALAVNVRKPTTPALVLLHWGAIGASYYWSIGDYDAALRVVAETYETAKQQGVQVIAARILTQQVHVHLARGEFQAAAATLKEVHEYQVAARGFDFSHYHFLVAMTALFQGDMVLARESIQISLINVQETGAAFPQLAQHFGAAQVAFAEGDYEKSAWHAAQGRGFMSSVTADYFCFLFEARLAFTRGDEATGLRCLRDALALAKQHGIVHYPWWSPAAMTEFYVKALDAGIEVAYVQSVIRKRKLIPETPPLQVEAWPFAVKLYTLGRFSVFVDGKPLQFSGKAQRKPLELLMALIAFSGRDVSEAQLSEALWPDADGDAAHEACAITLHRLRKLLGSEKAVILQNNQFSLNPALVWVDAWAFEHVLQQTKSAASSASSVNDYERLTGLYQGPFLGKKVDAPWALPARERLRAKFLRYLTEQGRRLMQAGQVDRAILIFEKGLDTDELAEEFYCNLMRCHQALGRHAEALSTYERCRKLLSITLGVTPSAETEAVARGIQASRS